MAQFNYIARTLNLKKETGSISASNEKDARSELKSRGLTILSLKKGKPEKEVNNIFKKDIFGSSSKEPKIPLKEVTLFSRQFATLIDAQVPITKSLYLLSKNTQHKGFSKLLIEVREQIEKGDSLSVALSKHPKVFPAIYIDMVAAGELSGALPEILDRLSGYMESDQALKSKVKSAMIYPSVVIVVAILAVWLMLLFVIPQFVPLFADLGEALPASTQLLLNMSTFAEEYWWALFAVFGVGFVFVKLFHKKRWWRKIADRVKLKAPVLGPVNTKSAIARFCRTLETLQKSGVPLMQSIEIVGRTSGNLVIEEAAISAIAELEKGETISKPLEDSGAFPPLVIQMITIGEETGELEKILSKVADFYEADVEVAVRTMTALIEPIIMVFLGIGIGFVAVSIISPMYGMMGAMQETI